jgi:aminopeptidase N
VRRTAPAALGLLVALAVAGCGGPSDAPGATRSTAASVPSSGAPASSAPARPTTVPTTRPEVPQRAPGRYGAATSATLEDSVYPDVGDPTVDALHYGLDLRWNRSTRRLVGTATIRFRVARPATKGIPLDLAAELVPSKVRLDGADVTARTEHAGNQLRVGTPITGGVHTLEVTYAGSPVPAVAPSTRGDTDDLGWTTLPDGQVRAMQEPYGAFTWFPVNDQPSDKAFYDIIVNAPAGWTGVSNGRLTSTSRVGRRTVTRWHLAHPTASYLTTIAIGPYHLHTDTGPHGLPISYWLRDADLDVLPVLQKAPQLLAFLEQRLGPLPSDRAGFLVVPRSSGMETQDMITFGVDDLRADDGEEVVHELAHQWYGDAVTPRDWRDVWMSEGMATYLQAEWTVEQGSHPWSGWIASFRDSDQQLRTAYGPPGAYAADQFAQSNVYLPPALMWRTLRAKIGAEAFDRIRRDWIQQNLYTNRDRDELADFWSKESGTDLHAFFTDWLMSATTPKGAATS